MSSLKRVVLILFFISLAVLCIALYWNSHLYYKADKASDSADKIIFLEDANRYFPFNDLVYYELGKAFYELGMQNLNDSEMSISLFQKAVSCNNRSLILNPASQYCHFSLARSLFYLNVLSPSLRLNPGDELKKAALLVDHNSQIYFEVAELFLGRWDELKEEDRTFTLDILRKILHSRDENRILKVFHSWEINVHTYEVVEKILPEDSFVFRKLAEYLGERALFLGERQKLLTESEYLEFGEAKGDHRQGENAFYRSNLGVASQKFLSCLKKLQKIRFYQHLTKQDLIDSTDFIQLQKSALLNLAKCSIEEKRDFKEAKVYLEDYLRLEEDARAINELESYLVERRIIIKNLEKSLDDMDLLSFHLNLAFRQNRYFEIMRLGSFIMTSYGIIPEEKKSEYVRILQILGEAFSKAGNMYDATEYYQKAYDLDPANLDTLLKMLQNYKRLNNTSEVQNTSQKIEKILFPKNREFTNHFIKKGLYSARRMVLDGREILVNLHIENYLEGVPPLISIIFNGHVVWEDFLEENTLSLNLEPKQGANIIQVVAVNTDLSFKRMSYRYIN